MAVEIVGGLEGKERRDANHDGSQDLIADIEIVVRVAATLMRQDAMVGIFRGQLGDADAERGPLLHALENEIHAVGLVLHYPAQIGQHVVLFTHALLGPFDGKLVIAGIRFHPVPVHLGALRQDRLIDDRHTDYIGEKSTPPARAATSHSGTR